jgi:hypothetical protein
MGMIWNCDHFLKQKNWIRKECTQFFKFIFIEKWFLKMWYIDTTLNIFITSWKLFYSKIHLHEKVIKITLLAPFIVIAQFANWKSTLKLKYKNKQKLK